MRNCNINQNVTTLYANKRWIVTLFCRFDFSKFPMDTQNCNYRQIFGSTSEVVCLSLFTALVLHPYFNPPCSKSVYSKHLDFFVTDTSQSKW